MRNIVYRKREKSMHPYVHPPPPRKEEMELRERGLKRDFATPLSVLSIVVSITILLLLIVGIVVVYVLHLF